MIAEALTSLALGPIAIRLPGLTQFATRALLGGSLAFEVHLLAPQQRDTGIALTYPSEN